jgi:hypothetical protein
MPPELEHAERKRETAADQPIRNVSPYKPVTLTNCTNVRLSYCEYAIEHQLPSGPNAVKNSQATSVSGNATVRITPPQRSAA